MAVIRANAMQNAFTLVFVINLLSHGQIETTGQMSPAFRDISRPTIGSYLNHAGYARNWVCNKVIGVLIITLASQKRENQLRAGRYASNSDWLAMTRA